MTEVIDRPRQEISVKKIISDPLLLILLALLAISVVAFLAGALPYPFGLLVLTILIMARILSKQ
jgi:hypothetical protein